MASSAAVLSNKLDECMRHLPVDLAPLLGCFSEESSRYFLQGNLLERLLVSLFNESDVRISSLETKAQVLGLLKAVALTTRAGLVRIRLLIHATPQWIDEDVELKGKLPSGLQAILRDLLIFMTQIWRYPRAELPKLKRDWEGGRLTLRAAQLQVLRHFAATLLQAAVRSQRARRALRLLLAQEREKQLRQVRQWSAVTIQRVARGYLVRRYVARPLRVRGALDRDLLRLAETYLAQGDLWTFLSRLDTHVRTLQGVASDAAQREDEYARTYLQQLVAQRAREFEGVWEALPRALAQHKHSSGPLAFAPLDNGEIGGGGTRAGAAPPGPLLRRAVQDTVQSEVARQLDLALRRELKSIRHVQSIQRIYGEGAGPRGGRPIGKRKGKGPAKSLAPLSMRTAGSAEAAATRDAA
eukprot:gene39692-48327_t